MTRRLARWMVGLVWPYAVVVHGEYLRDAEGKLVLFYGHHAAARYARRFTDMHPRRAGWEGQLH